MTAGSDLFYVSSESDMLDQVVAAHYGDTNGGKVDAVLAANPGLAALGVVLEPGVRIRLPDLTDAETTETAQLWG